MDLISPGMIVYSVRGRDKDHYYIVLENLDGNFISVVDGVYRKLANPKKKNVKHVEMSGIIIDVLKDKIQQGKMLQDSEITRHIREFQEKKIKEMIECPNKI